MQDRSDWMERYERWHATHGVPLGLRAGASEADLQACERVIGRELPPEFRAWLLRHNGQEMERHAEFAPGCNWLASADVIAKQWLDEAQWADDDDPGGDPQCRGRVQSKVFDKARIPIAGSLYWDGDRVYLDFSPGPQGTPGQVIALTSECDFEVLGSSFGDFMRGYVRLLESGELRAASDGVALPRGLRGHPAEWLAQRLGSSTAHRGTALEKTATTTEKTPPKVGSKAPKATKAKVGSKAPKVTKAKVGSKAPKVTKAKPESKAPKKSKTATESKPRKAVAGKGARKR